jgi:hypothetical protein
MVLAAALIPGARAFGQAPEGAMSEAEIESLRETKAVPSDRIMAFVKMLDDREHSINVLVSKPHRPAFNSDMHDAMEEFGAIADELNDNLDEYNKTLRDVRKVLPKLISATERWATSLRAAGEDEHFNVVRRIALSTLKDTHDLAVEMQESQARYFKEHPEAAQGERDRVTGNPRQ